MNFEKLLNENKIERVEKTEVDLNSVLRDLEFARNSLTTNYYTRIMAITYEAVLKTGNKLMNSFGYRAIGKGHHKNLFEFLMEMNLNQELVSYFDNVRKKRNDFIYRDIESVDESECKEIIEKAEEFVQEIRIFVQEIRTGEVKK